MKRLNGFFIIVALQMITALDAQNIFLHPLPDENMRLGVKVLRPEFTYDAQLSSISAAYDLYGNIPITNSSNLSLSLPVIIDAYDGTNRGNGTGNFFAGWQSRPDSVDSVYTSMLLGVFLPTASANHPEVLFLGSYAYFQEPQKAMANVLTLYMNYSMQFEKNPGKGWIYALEGGPQIFIPIKASAGSGELFLHYGLMCTYAFKKISFSCEILGLAGLTETYATLAERFDHSVGFAANFKFDFFRPSLFYQFITDDQTGIVINGIYGFKTSIIFH